MRISNMAAVVVLTALLAVVGIAPADDGTWIVDDDGDWSDPANWDGGIVAGGANATAHFAVPPTSNIQITINTARTIGHIVTGSTSSGSFQFKPASGGTLTLSAPGSQPSITVASGQGMYTLLPLAGTEGFTKLGPGNLGLNSPIPNTLSGVVDVQEGPLYLLEPDQLGPGVELVVGSSVYVYIERSHTIGSLAGAGNVRLWDDSDLDVGANGLSTEFSGTIEPSFGTSSLWKSGSGTLTLSGVNAYDGGTFLQGGTLSVSQESNLGDIAGGLTFHGGILQITGTAFGSTVRTITLWGNGGEFDIADPDHTFTFSQDLWGAYGLAKSGPGTLSLTGNNASYTGTFYAKEGTLGVGINNSLGDYTDVRIDAGAVVLMEGDEGWGGLIGEGELDLGGYSIELGHNGYGIEFDGTFSGTGQVTKHNSLSMVLTGDHTFSGTLTVENGAVMLRGNNGAMSGTIHVMSNRSLYAGINDSLSDQILVQLDAGATLTMEEGERWGSLSGVGNVVLGSNSIDVGYDNTDFDFSGDITGSGSFKKGGTGVMTLSGAGDWTGGTILEGGVLSVSDDAYLGDSDGPLTFDGGQLRITGTSFSETTRSITINEPSEIDVVDTGGTVALTADLTGTADLTKLGAGVLALRGSNAAYSGDIYVDVGTLALGVGDSLGNQTRVTLAPGTSLLMEDYESWGSLVGGGTVDLGSYHVHIGFDDSDAALSAYITGAGEVLKAGSGNLLLSSANDYAGGTIVEAGELTADHDSALGTGSVLVDTGGALAVADGAGTLTVADDYSQTASGTLRIELGGTTPGTEHDRLNVSGAANLAGALEVTLIDGFEPQIGDSFEILSAGNCVGTFDTVTYEATPSGGRWEIVYSPTAVTLVFYDAVLVDLNAPGPVHDGATWDTAYLTISDAIADPFSASAAEGIWVADGAYHETVTMQSGHRLYGGFTGHGGLEETELTQRDWENNHTTIDGDFERRCVHMQNTQDARLDGLVITDGWETDGNGGGVYCYSADSSTIITNCTITSNLSQHRGGGISIENGEPSISHCVIIYNEALGSGGIYVENGNPSISHCIISHNGSYGDNPGYSGGGIGCWFDLSTCHPSISNCLFYSNYATTWGGAIDSYDASPTIRNCTFSDNSADDGGGGISVRGSDASVLIVNAIFEDCEDGAVYAHDQGVVGSLENCLFHNNSSGAYYDDDGNNYPDSAVDDLNNENDWATGNITGTPLFLDKPGGDFHIRPCSAAVDQGASVPLTDDLDGNPRPVDIPGVLPDATGTEYDIGAYEALPTVAYAAVNPSSLDFGEQHPDHGPTDPLAVTIENLGSDMLQFTSITLSGSSDFEFASPPDTSDLSPCENRGVQIVFDPASLGEVTGSLLIESNDPANPTIEVPLSGVGSNLAPVAGIWPAGAALAFDGTDDYVNCGSDSVLMPTAAITVEAWINADNWKPSISAGTVVSKDQSGTYAGYVLRAADNGKASFVIRNQAGAWKEVISAEIMQAGQWHHIAGAYDGDNVKIFIDGVEQNSIDDGADPGITPSNTDLLIAESQGFAGRKFEGQIDDVRIWNHARDEVDIQTDMHHELAGDEPGLVGYWRLNEGSGYVTEDATANGNDGTQAGDPMWMVPSAAMDGTDELTAVTNEVTDLMVTLAGIDVDGGTLQALVTALPAAGTGQLYQYDGGVPGALIASVPTVVTDSERRVVYVPEAGAPYDSVFQWQVNDGHDDSANTATMAVSVCPAQAGDLDGDGDVDLDDFELFAECMNGPGNEPPGECEAADLDTDEDVDLADHAQFQALFTGTQP